MRAIIFFICLSSTLVYWSHQTLANSYCNGVSNKNLEFQKRLIREIPNVVKKDWRLKDIKRLSRELGRFNDGSYQSLPPVNISSLKRQIDWLVTQATFSGVDDNASMNQQVQVASLEKVFAMSQVITKRLNLGDQCD